MPNHCWNTVTVVRQNANARPAKAVIEDCMITVGEPPHRTFTFNKIVPQPPDLYMEPVGADAPEHNWYNWNNLNWGTKWDAYDCDYDPESITDDEAYIHFNTAWCPPDPVFLAWSKQLGNDYVINVECDIEGESDIITMEYQNGECLGESSEPRLCGECEQPEADHYDPETGDWIECDEVERRKNNADNPVNDCPHNNDISNDCKNCVFGEKNHWDGKACVTR